MTRANKLICPSCSTPLKSARGIRIGKKITCPKCQIGFTVRPEDAEQAELAAGTNLSRLAIVLAGALLYLMIGSWLAGYCFQHNDSRADVAKVEPGKSDGDGGTSVPAKAPATPKPGRVSPADQRKIDNAIANGVWFLKGHLRPDGAWGDSAPGLTNLQVAFASLPGLTLLECGVPGEDPAVQKAAALVREQAPGVGIRATYQLALAILFLDRLGEMKNRQYRDRELIQHPALRLIAGQRADGGWTYDCPTLDEKMDPHLLGLLNDPKTSLQEWHKAVESPFPAGGWDNSNTSSPSWACGSLSATR